MGCANLIDIFKDECAKGVSAKRLAILEFSEKDPAKCLTRIFRAKKLGAPTGKRDFFINGKTLTLSTYERSGPSSGI